MNLTDNFINTLNERKKEENLKQCILFGQIFGSIIFVLFFIKFLDEKNDFYSNIYLYTSILGIILFIIGIVCPFILFYPIKILKFVGNKVFNLIFSLILSLVYFIFVWPISIFTRKKYAQKYGYYKWNEKTKINFPGFKEKKENYLLEDARNIPTRIKIIQKIFIYFSSSKQYLFIPLIFILIFLGLLFFFITSSIITPIIYPLF